MRVKKKEIKKVWINLQIVGVILLSLLISIILLSPKMNSDTSKNSSTVVNSTETKGQKKETKEKGKEETNKVDNVKYKIVEFYNLNIVIPHEWQETDRDVEDLFLKKTNDSNLKRISIHKYNREVITIQDNKELMSTLGKAYIEVITTEHPDSNIISKMDLVGNNKDILYIKYEIEQIDENSNKYKEIRETYFIEKENEIYSFMSSYKKGIEEQIDGTKDEEIYNVIRMLY